MENVAIQTFHNPLANRRGCDLPMMFGFTTNYRGANTPNNYRGLYLRSISTSLVFRTSKYTGLFF